MLDQRIADIVSTKDKKPKKKPLNQLFQMKGSPKGNAAAKPKKAPRGFHYMPDGTLMKGDRHPGNAYARGRRKRPKGY